MTVSNSSVLASAALLALSIPTAACNIDVRHRESGGKAEVDITSPVGDLHVRTDVDSPDTGLAVYPGAQTLREDDDPGSADVNVGNSMFGVKVIAAKYESTDSQDKIIEFYRKELRAHGEVTECRGDIDFRGPRGDRHPVCKERLFSRGDLQLQAGREDRQRIVSVKPRGNGTEFALVYVQTRGES
jgi:hypothetical protein